MSVGVIRAARPTGQRLRERLGRLMSLTIPQLEREERIQDLATIRDRLLEEPGVLSVGLAINAPSQTRINAGVWPNGVQPADNVILWSAWQPVDGDLIETLQVPLLQGRLLDPQRDRADTENVAVVNEAFVRDVLKGEPALEARVSVGPDGHDRPSRIVGIVADTRNRGPAVPPGLRRRVHVRGPGP